MGFAHGNDLCLSFWSLAMEKGWIRFPPNARVLEIGCAEADWQTPMLALRPDLQITGLDWRACERPGRTVRGDVMDVTLFPAQSFDCIVSVSAIEHVGLGAYDGDPSYQWGDTSAMLNAWVWLKPGGWMYLDVPFRDDHYGEYGSYRVYNEKAINERLVVSNFVKKCWAKCVVDHPDSPYMALLLEKV
jgi:SAM-dependent methyltransferase